MLLARRVLTAPVAIALFTAPLLAQAPVGTAITYQGWLRNGGVPANGPHNMEFRLFPVPAGGSPVGAILVFDGVGTNPPPVDVVGGLFTVSLDFGAGAFNGDERWLEVKVASTTLIPRQRLDAAPYALYAMNASISPPLTLSGTSATHIIRGENASTNIGASGVTGASTAATGFTYGVLGQNASASGFGVYGYSTTPSGTAYGVWGQSVSTSGFGVVGSNSAASGLTYGGSFGVASTGGRAVNANASATTGSTYAGYFENASTSGTGVYARSSATSGSTYGFNAECSSTSGTAVFGLASAVSGTTYGVYGHTLSPSGYGVFGQAQAATGTNYGVFGTTNSASGWGVWAQGRLGTSATKSFQIDHPLDPENKKLTHYCSEGPEPLNVYSGNIVTDAEGLAWVTLPDYFDAINREPRYQLTVIGRFAQAIIAEEIEHNRFAIRTSAPHVRVSWEVKAVRNDRFAQRYGAPVEVEKTAEERGKYLVPALYDLPPERGIFYRPAPSANP